MACTVACADAREYAGRHDIVKTVVVRMHFIWDLRPQARSKFRLYPLMRIQIGIPAKPLPSLDNFPAFASYIADKSLLESTGQSE